MTGSMTGDALYPVLLALHIAAGCVSLAAAGVALAAAKGGALHRHAGRIYVAAMFAVGATTLLLVALRPNLFLLSIGVFSVYLVFTGWRAGVVRDGRPRPLDRAATVLMLAVGLGMLAFGLAIYGAGHQGPVLLVFGSIGLVLAVGDLRIRAARPVTGKARIARHLTRMLSGTIATLTAAAVVNVHFLPALVVWLGPTVLMTPVIAWWNVQVLQGRLHGGSAGGRRSGGLASAGRAGETGSGHSTAGSSP